MVIVMCASASEKELKAVEERLVQMGFQPQVIHGVEKKVLGGVGDNRSADLSGIELLPGVERVIRVLEPYKLVSRKVKERTVVQVAGARIGAGSPTFIAGPCAVESDEQTLETARAVSAAGAHLLRGGAFKPRTSPYSFQGLGEEGLRILARARDETGLGIVTEVMEASHVELVAEYADMLQIGSRNMSSFNLLKEVGRSGKPVLLKRGLASTIEEWLLAAEYILVEGNDQVVLCERGIRTFENATRNTLDLAGVALLKEITHLPVIVDPCHATGTWKLVRPLSRAAVALGADGLMVEVHPCPDKALCDGPQSLTPERFSFLAAEIRRLSATLAEEPLTAVV